MFEELRQKMEEEGYENFLVLKGSNLFYLLDVYNISGALVIKPETEYLVTSKFFKYSVEKLDIETKIYSDNDEKEEILENLDLEGEIGSDSPERIEEYTEVDRSEAIEEMRRTKSEEEIERIIKASKGTVKGIKALRGSMEPGKTEWELASVADARIRKTNSYNAFETIVQAKGIEPHRPPKDKKIGDELVIVDLGAKFKGYCSDMTRTFCLNPTEEQKRLYNDVLDIYNAVYNSIGVGKKFSNLVKKAESLAEEKGYSLDRNFLHRIGHSLGVDIHESPGFDPQDDTEIREGMVFTLEPGLYVPEIGGVRIEDTISIRKNGEKEILTRFPKEL